MGKVQGLAIGRLLRHCLGKRPLLLRLKSALLSGKKESPLGLRWKFETSGISCAGLFLWFPVVALLEPAETAL